LPRKREKNEETAAAEAAFLASYDPSAFERLSVAVDVVLFGIVRDALHVLLVRRDGFPFRGAYALPGGFVAPVESLDAAAARILSAKAKLSGIFLEQLYTFGEPDRDPRTRVVGIAYYALVDEARFTSTAAPPEAIFGTVVSDPGGRIRLLDEDDRTLDLAFDHNDIVALAVARIRGKLDYAPIGFELLPERFTLLELQRVHERIAGRSFNKDSFRRKVLASGLIAPTGASQVAAAHRPAALYRFARPKR
jgi:8-oxo-dGTP diphosphatase